MHPTEEASQRSTTEPQRPRWNDALRALREARGVTQDGWAALIGVSRKTVQRWEAGERPPDAGAEAAILDYCRERDLLRPVPRGPLAGLALTPEMLRDLLIQARLSESSRQVVAGDDATAPVAPHQPANPPTNLPAPLTSFVGRQQERAAVRRLLGSTRLLTLAGAGGCGKTRLALAVGEESLPAWADGVWLVELAGLAEPALVPDVAAVTLAAPSVARRPAIESLTEHLRPRHLLLILDNCEHLLGACAELSHALLRACPNLTILATSRERLGVAGETVWRVPPMAVARSGFGVRGAGFSAARVDDDDAERRTPNPERDDSDAVRLFVARARQFRSDFAVTDANEAAIIGICERLDGIPLAIELAAARVRVLSVEGIAARLDDRFALLTGSGCTALPRHRTLRATLDWSHDLLAEEECALLRALSVFAGGFEIEGAEAVAAGDLPPVLDPLAALVDKSLVAAEERGGAVRYRLLETVRQYAGERLDEAGETRVTRERHAAWCLALAEAAWIHRTGPQQDVWWERLAVEHDNLRAALSWFLADERGGPDGLRLAGLLWRFWEVRGHIAEGRHWLTASLAGGGQAPLDVRAKALEGAGWLAMDQGDYDEAARLHERSLELRRELGDDPGIAGALINLGTAHGARDDHAGARALFEASLTLARARGDPFQIGAALMNLGIVARREGQPDRAVALFEEGLAVTRQMGDTRHIANGLMNLGNALRDQGQPDEAAVRYREGLPLFRTVQDRLGAARCLEGLAGIAAEQGDAERAARLGGAAAGLREAIGVPLPPTARAGADRTRAAARAALGEDAFAAAWAAGGALSLDGAVAAALDDAQPARFG